MTTVCGTSSRRIRTKARTSSGRTVRKRPGPAWRPSRRGRAPAARRVLEQIQVATRDDVDYRAFCGGLRFPGGSGGGRRRLRLYLLHLWAAALRQHAPGGAAGDQGGKADRGLRHRSRYLHVHLRCVGAPVLACTYAILRSTATFTRKVNIRIIQCDDRVRSDTVIHELEDLRSYMDNFTLKGAAPRISGRCSSMWTGCGGKGRLPACGDWCTLPTAWASIRPSGRLMTWPSCCWRSRRFP